MVTGVQIHLQVWGRLCLTCSGDRNPDSSRERRKNTGASGRVVLPFLGGGRGKGQQTHYVWQGSARPVWPLAACSGTGEGRGEGNVPAEAVLRGDDCSKSVPCKRLWHAKSTRERRCLGEKHEHRRHDREEVTARTRVAGTAVTKAKEKAKPKQEGNSRQCLRTASTFPFLGPTGEVLGRAVSTRGHVQETNWLANTTEEEGTHRHPGTRNRA